MFAAPPLPHPGGTPGTPGHGTPGTPGHGTPGTPGHSAPGQPPQSAGKSHRYNIAMTVQWYMSGYCCW